MRNMPSIPDLSQRHSGSAKALRELNEAFLPDIFIPLERVRCRFPKLCSKRAPHVPSRVPVEQGNPRVGNPSGVAGQLRIRSYL